MDDKKTQLQVVPAPARACPSILADELTWQATGPEEDVRGRLLAQISVAGVSMHLEAWAVQEKDGFQVSDVWDDDFQQIAAGIGIEEHWHTVEMGGREYVLIATPYC